MEQEISPTSKCNETAIKDDTSCLFNVGPAGLSILLESGLELNHLYVLEQIAFSCFIQGHIKLQNWVQTLVRKRYVTPELELTLSGTCLLEEVRHGRRNPMPQYTKADDPFELWWKNAYPHTDMFEYNGISFTGTQSKLEDKEGSRKQYWEGINELRITTDDLFWATVCQVDNSKKLSLRSGRSELRYLPNSYRYLKLRYYKPFIEEGRKRRSSAITDNSNPFIFIV